MAISQIFKERFTRKNKFIGIGAMEFSKRLLVLSLGTGAAKHEEKYTATAASKWGLVNWLYNNGATPLLDVYGDASSDMVDFHVSTLFPALGRKNNYLRIQVSNDHHIYFIHLWHNLLPYAINIFFLKYELG